MKERSGYLSQQKSFISIFVIFFIGFGDACAQGNPSAIGARSWGIANATVANSDLYSVFNNIAGIGGNREMAIFSTYDSHYGFDGLNTMGFGGVVPVNPNLSSGFTFQRFGDKLYNELVIGAGAGHTIERFSLGMKVNYLQTAVNSSSSAFSRKAFVVEFGGIVKVSSQLFFGAHLYNLTQSSYSGIYGNKVPTLLRLGFLFVPSKTIRLSSDIEKDTNLPVSIKAGLAYTLWKKVWLRTGVGTKPLTNHFGAGFKGGKFSIDYAAHSNANLGWSHHFSIAYAFWEIADGNKGK